LLFNPEDEGNTFLQTMADFHPSNNMALYPRKQSSSEYVLVKQANDYVTLTSIRSYALVKIKNKIKKSVNNTSLSLISK
jgi:hypothetical protein